MREHADESSNLQGRSEPRPERLKSPGRSLPACHKTVCPSRLLLRALLIWNLTLMVPTSPKFSAELGRICEKEIAFVVLKTLCDPGTNPRDLNNLKSNHYWADWAIQRNNELHIFAVRGRVKWEKPQESHFRKGGFTLQRNASFNKARGEELMRRAVESVRGLFKLPPGKSIQPSWLSVSVDLDGTYDAYWGPATEMRAGGGIPMRQSDIDGYAQNNRRLRFRKPHNFPWHIEGHWACEARKHWLKLKSILNPGERIRRAAELEFTSRPVVTQKTSRSSPEKTASKLLPRPHLARVAKTERMAHRIRRGALPWERLCLLRVLSSDPPKQWSMREIANAMRAQRARNGQFYRNDSYNESAKALDAAGLVRSTPRGRGLLRQITRAGLGTLEGSSRSFSN
jgi:hypothetical protein